MIGHDGNSAGLWFLRGAQLFFSAVEGTINTFILLLGVSRMRKLPLYQNIFLSIFGLVGMGRTIFSKIWTNRWICEQSKLASIEPDSPTSFSELHFEFSEESSSQIGKPVFSFIFNIYFFFFLPLSVRDMETWLL